MDVCIALGVHCECQDGCMHSSGCVLRVSRWMGQYLWVCAESVKMDVCIALGVHCECQDGCVHSSGIAL